MWIYIYVYRYIIVQLSGYDLRNRLRGRGVDGKATSVEEDEQEKAAAGRAGGTRAGGGGRQVGRKLPQVCTGKPFSEEGVEKG